MFAAPAARAAQPSDDSRVSIPRRDQRARRARGDGCSEPETLEIATGALKEMSEPYAYWIAFDCFQTRCALLPSVVSSGIKAAEVWLETMAAAFWIRVESWSMRIIPSTSN
jgi:hypothetical protein